MLDAPWSRRVCGSDCCRRSALVPAFRSRGRCAVNRATLARRGGLLSAKACCPYVRLLSQDSHAYTEWKESPKLRAAPKLCWLREGQRQPPLHQAACSDQAVTQSNSTAALSPAQMRCRSITFNPEADALSCSLRRSNCRSVKPDHQCAFANHRPSRCEG